MNPKNKAWTYQEEQKLIDLRYDNVPLKEVAKKLGRSIDSCRKKHFLLMEEAFTPKWWEKIRQNEPKVKVR